MEKKPLLFIILLISILLAIDSYDFMLTGAATGNVTVNVVGNITISNVQVSSITTSGATVTYDTSINTNSSINYSTTIDLGTEITNTTLDASHAFILSGLSSSTTYYFNVTSCRDGYNCTISGPYDFTTSAPAVPTEEPAVGGGAYRPSEVPSFEISEQIIKIGLKEGGSATKDIKIENTGDKETEFKLLVENDPEGVIEIREISFILKPGEIKTIRITLFGTKIGVFTSKIKIIAAEVVKYITIISEIESRDLFFDLSLDLPAEFAHIYSGENITFYTNLINIMELEEVEVEFEFIIKNLDNKIIYSEIEKTFIIKQASFSKTIKVPDYLDLGDYLLVAKIKYRGRIGTSSRLISIVEKPDKTRDYIIIGLVSSVMFIFLITSYFHNLELKRLRKIKFRDLERKRGSLKRYPLKEKLKFKKRIKRKLRLLGDARRRGYISKNSYNMSKKRLEKIMKSLKHIYKK